MLSTNLPSISEAIIANTNLRGRPLTNDVILGNYLLQKSCNCCNETKLNIF